MEKKTSLAKFKRQATHDEFLKGKLIEVIQDGKKSYHEILMYINNEIQESTRTVAFEYSIKCFQEDGAFALSRAVEEINGFSMQKKKESMSGTNPPTMLDVRFADGTHMKVPFGTMDLPTFGNDAYIEMHYNPGVMTMMLIGQCEKRYVAMMDEIVDETRRIITNDSIYRGKAIKITEPGVSPTFIDLSGIDKTPMFLTKDAKYDTQPIEARIERTAECTKHGIDIRFGVLLEGTYGLEN